MNAAIPMMAATNVATVNSAASPVAAGSPAAVTLTETAAAPAAAAEKTVIAALAAVARPERAATTALRECSKLAAGERRACARTLVLARRREGSESGTLKLQICRGRVVRFGHKPGSGG